MIRDEGPDAREPKTVSLEADLIVAGGGLAGTCCAITAAREGLRVVLVQDRPVLGGNASSEVRLWTLGATAHMGNNNRFAREGGVVGEYMIENLFRNREGNPLIVDSILLEMAHREKNLTLLLNTMVYEVAKATPDRIESLTAFNSQNSTRYRLRAPFFADCTGDGLVGFQAGAAFRMGAETREEFGEGFATDEAFGHLLGHSLYFYTKDVGRPVKFVPPSFALEDVKTIPRYRNFNLREHGCKLWWIEYGGRLDTVHETEAIKWELWKVVYGVWNYMKNSGEFPEADTMTLEWVGHIPGKRESRRFEGDYLLRQQDVIEQREHPDVVAYGGWSIDHHPGDGIYSDLAGSRHGHAKGIYGIPYRCYYSHNISNLFFAGRNISATHVAFGTTRVMATCSLGGQAVGMAAAIATELGLKSSREVGNHLDALQERLLENGNFLPDRPMSTPSPVKVEATSEFSFTELPFDGEATPLDFGWAQMLPVPAGELPAFTFMADVARDTVLNIRFCRSRKKKNYCPEIELHRGEIPLKKGLRREFTINPSASFEDPGFLFICFARNPDVALVRSRQRVTATLSLRNRELQELDPDTGVEAFHMWLPERRPGGHNFAFRTAAPLSPFAAANACNGWSRPYLQANAWVAAVDDPAPTLTLSWTEARRLAGVRLYLDPDYDHPMESVLWGHPESVVPFTVRHFRIWDDMDNLLFEEKDNHAGWRFLTFARPVKTRSLRIELLASHGSVPVAIFECRPIWD